MAARPESPLLERNLQTLLEVARELQGRLIAWRRGRVGLRGALLYALPIPLPLAAVIALGKGDWVAALVAAGALAAMLAGAHVNRAAIREELVAPTRRFSRPRRPVLKYSAAALTALGTSSVALGVAGHDAVTSALFGLLAIAGFHLAYRLPRPSELRPTWSAPVADERTQQALARAEQKIIAIESVADTVGNPELAERLTRIISEARRILELIARRPGELSRARKFLSVYLEGAERVASRYVATHRLARSRELEQSFRTVLSEIESVFEQQRIRLAAHDVEDLDVQIEVLRKRLAEEGIV